MRVFAFLAKNDVKTFLTRVQGFTPVIDALAEELSTLHALVYGVVWRFCQMDDRVCKASTETLAEKIGISRKTVWRYLKELCEQGYLDDLTPDRRNVPHVYRDTGKAKILGLVEGKIDEETVSERDSSSIEAEETVAQRDSLPQTVAERDSPDDGERPTVSLRDSGVSQRDSSAPTVSLCPSNCLSLSHEESIKKEVLKKEERREAVAQIARWFKLANQGAFPKGTQEGIEKLFERFPTRDILEVGRRMAHSWGFTIPDMRTVLESQQTRGP